MSNSDNEMRSLEQMATLAAQRRLMGSSFKRNSLIKPLDIILENLEREPRREIRGIVQAAAIDQIDEHLNRITQAEYRLGYAKRDLKRDIIADYVDLFFSGLLKQEHRGDVNRLLQRKKLFRSAYLIYFRNALSQKDREETDRQQAGDNAGTDGVSNE
ncbi:MAG: hypothetical protein M3Z04_03370 [Chloroflexota bacterium]|nr:hypothetical protein [Chloroflexota bacterium]